MQYLLYGAMVVLILLGVAMVFAPKRELVTEIAIDASPFAVWSILSDGARYPDWNPFIVRMDGEIRPGATLQNTLQPEPGRQMVFRPLILVVEPERELRWLGRLFLPRIFDGEHYFLLEERNGTTHLVHGERFSGIFLWFIDPEGFRANFEAMNAALKARAENP